MSSQSPESEVRRARPALGTLVDVRAGSDRLSSSQLHAAVDAAFAQVELVHRLMSYQEADSELTRLNHAQADVLYDIDAHTYNVLSAAILFARVSEGAFDPCVVDSRPERSTWRDIELVDGRYVRFTRRVRIDLSGIAKGYAVDLATRTLQRANVEEILVNAGGDLRVCGTRVHEFGLRHPHEPTAEAGVIALDNGALATSGSYFVPALIDPGTGNPYLADDSVTVRAGDCMSADALTKIVLFARPVVAKRALAQYDAHAYVLRPLTCSATSHDGGRIACPE